MSTQLLHSEVKSDKQALASVLQFLKNQNLTETEETLRRELGVVTSKGVPGVLQSSQTQPEQVDEAYSNTTVEQQQRTQSLNIDPEDETISVDDDEEDDDGYEDEGPHSWPGRNTSLPSSSVSSETFLDRSGSQFPSVRPASNQPSFSPLMLKSPPLPHSGLAVPTLFTIVPSGLIQHTPTTIKPFLTQTSPVTSMPSLIKSDNPLTMAQVPKLSVLNTVSNPPPLSNSLSTKPQPQQQQSNNKFATTLAAIPPEEMTPAYHELKEFAESFKTKRIQLGYTQGAVGQSLADRGYSNFAQSTISRFEQMQLSPSNAAAIKVVLERWLLEADNPDAVTSTTMDPLGPPRKRKKRAVFSTQTREALEEYFHKEARPNRQIIEKIANELNLLPEEVRVWFCNKRQKFKISDENCMDDGKSLPPSPASSRSTSSPRTKFTIEELSKSSSVTTHSFSPVSFSSAFAAVSPQRLQPIMFPSGSTVAITSPPFLVNNLVTKA